MQTKSNDTKALPAPRVYSVKDACVVLKISHSHFYNMVKSGALKTKKLGRKTLVPIESIDAFLREGS